MVLIKKLPDNKISKLCRKGTSIIRIQESSTNDFTNLIVGMEGMVEFFLPDNEVKPSN